MLTPGTPVRFKRSVERYPNFIVEPGATGVVAEVSPNFLAVLMDIPLAGAEEWDNKVHWCAEDMDDIAAHIEFRQPPEDPDFELADYQATPGL